MPEPRAVLRFADIDAAELNSLLSRFQLEVCITEIDQDIPGSYWGDEEAGLIGNRLYLRSDTPLHSILHEASHYICMDQDRREKLHTNAGSDDTEENAVCYLQILLAERLLSMGRERALRDMDSWGYSFRLGSARAWFEEDASDAHDWLLLHQMIDDNDQPVFRLRRLNADFE
jgi:hypothetical protein